MTKDLPGTLKKVAEIGYECVEFYSPYFAWTFPFAKEVRSRIDDLGLRCYSTHNQGASLTPGETMARAIELNQILGSRMLVCASPPRGTTGVEGWKRACATFTTAVEQLAPHGLTAGFHNHKVEWAALEGEQRIMDFIAANTPKEFVLQFDVGTCMEAGADPIAWINANPGRIRSVHLKDWAPGTRAEEKGYRVLFGDGVALTFRIHVINRDLLARIFPRLIAFRCLSQFRSASGCHRHFEGSRSIRIVGFADGRANFFAGLRMPCASGIGKPRGRRFRGRLHGFAAGLQGPGVFMRSDRKGFRVGSERRRFFVLRLSGIRSVLPDALIGNPAAGGFHRIHRGRRGLDRRIVRIRLFLFRSRGIGLGGLGRAGPGCFRFGKSFRSRKRSGGFVPG